MYARNILINALSCIQAEGYVTKDASLISGKKSTAQKVADSLEVSPDASPEDEATYGPKADAIIDWILGYTGDNDYMRSCKDAIGLADLNPHKTFGFIASLVPSYEKHLLASTGLDKVSAPNAFAGDPGARVEELRCEVINVQHFREYYKISLVDSEGHLITYTVNKEKKTKKSLTLPRIGDKLIVSGLVYRNKFSTPFETTLSRPKVTGV